MKDGLKVFDADSHVRYPADLWERFLEPRFRSRVGRRQPFPDFEVYNPTTVDGAHVHHEKYISGSPRLTKIIKWTREDLVKNMRALGDDHIVYETDFPHPDSKFPHATEYFLSLAPDRISRDSKRKILWDNAIDLYRFPRECYPQSVATVN